MNFSPHQTKPPPSSASSPLAGFKLRPRSNSHPLAEVSGHATAASMPQLKPVQRGVHSISPDGPMFPSTRSSDNSVAAPINEAKAPPPSFALFFGSAKSSSSSPIKKQKTQDRLRLQLSPDSSPSGGESEDSQDEYSAFGTPPVDLTITSSAGSAPMFPPLMKFPSTPADDQESSPSNNGKRALPPGEDEGNSCEEASSPFTPKGRELMQNLCINSPSPTLSSMSPTPENSPEGSKIQLIHQQLPYVPTFSFSPSLNMQKARNRKGSSVMSSTVDSSVRDTIVFSAGSTPVATPIKGRKGSNSVSSSPSPLHSLRVLHSLPGQRTPIGHQRGSVFKTLPPRLYPNGRDDAASSVTSMNTSINSITCSSPFSTSSPSPRVVPLTVLSRDGSPMVSPKRDSVGMPSPLLRSLDTLKDSTQYLLSPSINNDVKMPNISSLQASPMASDTSQHTLPRIKLTPRTKKNFASAKLNSSPGDEGGGLSMPRLTLVGPKDQRTWNIIETASSFMNDFPGDKEAAEMDFLLSGFGHHKAAAGEENHDRQPEKGSFGRVESEEAEIASLTQGYFQMPSLWIPPTAPSVKENYDGRCSCSSLGSIDGDASHSSAGDRKPMPSITLNLPTGQKDASPSVLLGTSPSFLPRPVPTQKKCRSLFGAFNAQEDPLDSLIRADAIAEAARSNEPLTDEDSAIDEDDLDLLLCLPQSSTESESPSKFSNTFHVEKKAPFKPSHATFRAESPLLHFRTESPLFNKSRTGSFMRRNKCSDSTLHGLTSPTTPTIFEEGLTTLDRSTRSERSTTRRPHAATFQGLNKRETSDSTFTTFCSLSDCDASEIMASPKYSRTKALDRQSVCSLLSMSSLCGLDIVHESSAGIEAIDRVPVLLPSTSSEFSATMFRPMQRSEFSMNSLGLSVDSAEAGMEQRDLFTPPMGVPTSKQALSPPPLRCRASPVLDAFQRLI